MSDMDLAVKLVNLLEADRLKYEKLFKEFRSKYLVKVKELEDLRKQLAVHTGKCICGGVNHVTNSDFVDCPVHNPLV